MRIYVDVEGSESKSNSIAYIYLSSHKLLDEMCKRIPLDLFSFTSESLIFKHFWESNALISYDFVLYIVLRVTDNSSSNVIKTYNV